MAFYSTFLQIQVHSCHRNWVLFSKTSIHKPCGRIFSHMYFTPLVDRHGFMANSPSPRKTMWSFEGPSPFVIVILKIFLSNFRIISCTHLSWKIVMQLFKRRHPIHKPLQYFDHVDGPKSPLPMQTFMIFWQPSVPLSVHMVYGCRQNILLIVIKT